MTTAITARKKKDLVGEVVKDVRVLNLGAGVQSTTLYLMFAQNQKAIIEQTDMPWPHIGWIDYAVFADTGDEPVAVYKHLDWLISLNGPEILVRSRGKLSADLMRGTNSTRQRFVSIPAYTRLPGQEREGRTRRQCSKEYKVEVIERTIRRDICGCLPGRRIPKTVNLTQFVGISIDEYQRFERLIKRRTLGTMRAPLSEMRMTRDHCKQWLEKYGNVPHETPRSACVYCPMHDEHEWLRVKAVPEDWKLAVELDTKLREEGVVVNRNMEGEMFLHRTCQPLVQIDFQKIIDERKEKELKNPKTLELPFSRDCLGACGL